jgi:hypothetical protein
VSLASSENQLLVRIVSPTGSAQRLSGWKPFQRQILDEFVERFSVRARKSGETDTRTGRLRRSDVSLGLKEMVVDGDLYVNGRPDREVATANEDAAGAQIICGVVDLNLALANLKFDRPIE